MRRLRLDMKTGARLAALVVTVAAQPAFADGTPYFSVTQIVLPSGDELGLYEPRHPTAIGKTR